MEALRVGRSVLEAGTTLGGTYQIGRIIGQGGMGEVYEARHARLAGRYAVKVIRREAVNLDPATVQRFQREAEVTSSLRHPNIVQVIDFDVAPDGSPYIVMEYLEGTDLQARMNQRGPMPVAEVLVLVGQIASALAAAHERGVIHRDLKPANIFLVPLPAAMAGHPTEFVKILDFGISKVKAAGTLTRQPNIMGTPHYMAPEQARMQNDAVDGRTDQFALAAMIYEMLTGRKTFPGDTIEGVLYSVVHEQPAPVAHVVGESVERALMTALSKDRALRHPSVTAFAAALHAAAARGGQIPIAGDPHAAGSITFETGSPIVGQPVAASPTIALPGTPATPAATTGKDSATTAPPRRARGAIAVLVTAAVVAVAGLAVFKSRDQAPATSAAPPPAAALAELAASVHARVERALGDESRAAEVLVQAAARIPELRNAVTTHIDTFTFNDLFATEEWWQPYRGLAAVVFDGERPLVTRGLPDVGNASQWRFWAGKQGAPVSALVLGDQRAYLAAGVALDATSPSGLVLGSALDADRLARLAHSAHVDRLIVSDGKRLFGVSPGAGDGALASLIGREAQPAVALTGDQVAIPVARPGGVWLWAVVSGSTGSR